MPLVLLLFFEEALALLDNVADDEAGTALPFMMADRGEGGRAGGQVTSSCSLPLKSEQRIEKRRAGNDVDDWE